jgi:hypothetical protein
MHDRPHKALRWETDLASGKIPSPSKFAAATAKFAAHSDDEELNSEEGPAKDDP